MLEKEIEEICKTKILGSPKFQWYKDTIAYIEYDLLQIAFDIVIGDSYLGIDLVLRPKANKSEFISLYPSLKESYKHRLATIDKGRAGEFIANIINTEYSYIVSKLDIKGEALIRQDQKLHYITRSGQLTQSAPLKMYFWTGVPNFGDLVGPWLGSRLTDRPVLNVRNIESSKDAVFGVGSIIGMIGEQHQRCRIWGSGLISDKYLYGVVKRLRSANLKKITGVRGKITERILTEKGFSVDKVYGDPALIFSDLYHPNRSNLAFKKVIVPHYIHYDLFTELNLEGFHIVDVRSGLTKVIDEISSADVVISTSLHGIILAQSYGIPWAHLHLHDELPLAGDDFKFHDFFTVLDETQASQVKVSIKDLNQHILEVVFRKAQLPRYDNCYSSQAIIDAFFKAIS